VLTGPEAVASAARIAPIYLEGRLLPIQDDLSRSLGLSLHDVVRAVVEARAESVVLNLNGRALTLPPGLQLRPGEEVWLRYLHTRGGPAFQLLPASVGAQAAAQAADLSPLAPAPPAQTLPGASPPGPLPSLSLAGFLGKPSDFGLLSQMLSATGLAGLLRASASMARLHPDAVRQALRASGLFFESKLAQGQPTASDLKAALQILLTKTLQESPQDLEAIERLQAGLREITHAQVDTLVAAGHREMFLHFLIPFQDAPPADIRFFRPPPTEDSPNPPYTIDIHTRSDSLGQLWMTAQIAQAQPADRIEMTMWVERPDVARDARRAAGELKDDLADAGLELVHLHVLEGLRPASLALTPTAASSPAHLLDQRA